MTMNKVQQKNVFKLLLGLTIVVALIASALIAFCFICVDRLELMQCLLIGVCIIALVALTTVTVWRGLAAYKG